jgi:hypothetical protein
MMTQLRIALVLGVSIVSACKGGSAKVAVEAKPIGDTGFVVDAPADWTVTKDMKDFYSVKAAARHGGFVQIMINDGAGAASLEDAVKATSCTDATKAKTEKTASGTLFVQCEGAAGTMGDKPLVVTKVHSQLTVDGHSADCHLDTDQNVDVVAAICKSLRKK